MSGLELNYFDWEIVADGVVEITIHKGVELDGALVEEGFALVKASMPEKFCVLTQRRENYSHTLESMIALSRVKNVLLYALVVSNNAERELGQSHKIINQKVRLFSDREQALEACKLIYQEHILQGSQ